MMKPPPEIRELCQAFVRGLDVILGDKLYGVYLYGAMAFPEGGSTGDIDAHVILKVPLSQQQVSQLHRLHSDLARDHPPLRGALMFSLGLDFLPDLHQTAPGPRLRQAFEGHRITLSASGALITQVRDGRWQIDDHDSHGSYVLLQESETIDVYGAALDVYYILLRDARRKSPPQHQLVPGVRDESWALHRQHIRAGRCIVLHGPDPRQVYPPASWPELASALQGELDYVKDHLDEYPQYCVLNLCRLMYSYRTRDVVVSKQASAAWACDAFPQWQALIDAARKAYDQQATAHHKELLQCGVRPFFAFACERIQDSLARSCTGASPPLTGQA